MGRKITTSNRINGLVDKLISSVNTDNVIDLYTNFDTRIDIIHVDDLVDLIEKCIEKNLYIKHDMFVVGSQSLTIKQLLDIITSSGYVNLKLSRKESKSYLYVETRRVLTSFEWKPKCKLI